MHKTDDMSFFNVFKVFKKPVVYFFPRAASPLHVLILIKTRSCPASHVLVLVLFFSLKVLM